MPCHTIQVSRPFEVVARQVLELNEAWLADAVRTAGVAACRGTPPGDEGTAGFQVRVGWPCRRWGLLRLPMEWEVTGVMAPRALSGELEVRQVSADETRIGVKMALSKEPAVPQGSEPVRVVETAELVTRLFLQRVFWTLEALSRSDLIDPPGAEMTGPERRERQRSPDGASARGAR